MPEWAALGRVFSVFVLICAYFTGWSYATHEHLAPRFSEWWLRIHVVVITAVLLWWFIASWLAV